MNEEYYEKDLFMEKWRKKMGCDESGVCWCEVCCNLEKIWDEMHRIIAKSILERTK